MRVGVVHGDQNVAELLRGAIVAWHGGALVWTAKDGPAALVECKRAPPDVVLLGVPLAGKKGPHAASELIGQILATVRCAVLLVAAEGAATDQVYEAMSHGALDVIALPASGGVGRLTEKVEAAAKLMGVSLGRARKSSPLAPPPCLIALGASTGGPEALVAVLAGLGADTSAAVVIVQHVEADFAPGMANWLGQKSDFPVALAVAGDRPQSGRALLAGGREHLILDRTGVLEYTPKPRDHIHRPSVDVFFKSVADSWRGAGCAALLTGMGRDGAEGLLALRKRGFYTIAQDRSTSVVFGMPRAAAELEAADRVLPLEGIGPALRVRAAGARAAAAARSKV
jgi:two-component system response regulator WspF